MQTSGNVLCLTHVVREELKLFGFDHKTPCTPLQNMLLGIQVMNMLLGIQVINMLLGIQVMNVTMYTGNEHVTSGNESK